MAGSPTLSGQAVLITRPGQYADYLSMKITELGGQSIIFPTLEVRHRTEGLHEKTFSQHDVAVFISRNAVAAVAEFFDQSTETWPQSLQCAAVGSKTADAIRAAFGIQDVIAPSNDQGVQALMALDYMRNLTDRRVIFFDGGGARSALFIHELQGKGCAMVTHAIVYERLIPKRSADSLAHILKHQGIDYVILTSVAGASNLISLLNPECVKILKSAWMVVYSERIARQLADQEFERIAIARTASDDAAIEAILSTQTYKASQRPGYENKAEIITMD